MNGGNGNDFICNYQEGENVSINGGDYVTVNGGAGNDSIILARVRIAYADYSNPSTVIEYSSGDGDDTITGFDANDTLSIAGSYTRSTVDNDVIFSVGNGSITLKDAKGKTINIDSTPLSLLVTTDGYNSQISELNLLSDSTDLVAENNLLAYSGEK